MLDLVIEGDVNKEWRFEVRKMINGGLSNRDQSSAQKHLDEIKKEGVDIKVDKTPVLFPKISNRITISNRVEVLVGSRTCGEAEPVLLMGEDNSIYVAAGSDHSDRELEKHDLVISKQMCPNVISKHIWRYEDVKERWDALIMRGWVIEENGKRQLYQEGRLGEFMSVQDFLDKVKERVEGDLRGSVIFMGTFPTLGGKLIYSPGFEAELLDEHTGRRLTCKYFLEPMSWFK